MLWQWSNRRKQVFILDLDGTLIPSAEVDNTCFWEAVFACYGHCEPLPELHEFNHVTDSGILDEWCQKALGRLPLTREIMQIKQVFLQKLESAFTQQPWHFKALPGVRLWLQTAHDNESILTGIATGGWEHSARLKLKLAGLDSFNLPLASSDDAVQRTEIMRIAAQRVLGKKGDDETVITYVGDGPWDVRASQALGWEFIGIGTGEQESRLREAGAGQILRDFCRPELKPVQTLSVGVE